ncbi:MAG: YccF domain-containing protein [Clostridia bacterium]|nr:YccF domain-containing protein [Clostridia bacterium]
MRLIGNILWFILGGIWLGLSWFLLGLLLCITVVGIPLGLQCFKAASLTFTPFGKEVTVKFDAHPIANILWALLVGWEMALGYLVSGVISCITLIGIPFGLQAFKMMKLAFLPFGAQIKETA